MVKKVRLITHTDFDGIACAVLISESESIDSIEFTDPTFIKKRRITDQDVICDLPYKKGCALWFDHHISNRIETPFQGSFKIAPSCARVVYEFYENDYLDKYKDLLYWADRIDGGLLSLEEIMNPKDYYLLSITLDTDEKKKDDDKYRLLLIDLLRKKEFREVMENKEVVRRSAEKLQEVEKFKQGALKQSKIIGKIAVVDIRSVELPKTNNYVLYTLFPEVEFSLKIFSTKEGTRLSLARNIFVEKKTSINIGALMKKYGGGGHENVGGTTLKNEAERKIGEIIAEVNKA